LPAAVRQGAIVRFGEAVRTDFECRYDGFVLKQQTGRNLTALVALISLAAPAQQQAQPADKPYAIQLRVGESVDICKTGTIACPANNPICDDTSIVGAEIRGAQGLVFKGLKPGTTLCSAAAGSGFGLRRVYRVTVS